ncbi:cupin domain-containing protein [Hymenobacter daeguensis]
MTQPPANAVPTPTYLRAIRLLNTPDGGCAFETGRLPTGTHLAVSYAFAATHDDNENLPHAAPRTQYVVTLRGRLRFTVSSGETFIIEPGIILVAKDVQGPGHTWELMEGEVWERLYLPFAPEADDHFLADGQ